MKAPLHMVRWRRTFGMNNWPPSLWNPPFGAWHVVGASFTGIRTQCGHVAAADSRKSTVEILRDGNTNLLQIIKPGESTPEGDRVCKACAKAYERYPREAA